MGRRFQIVCQQIGVPLAASCHWDGSAQAQHRDMEASESSSQVQAGPLVHGHALLGLASLLLASVSCFHCSDAAGA